MKFFTLTLIVLVIASIANAQIQKKTIQVGGSVGFSRSSTKNTTENAHSNSFNFSPSAGKFYAVNRLVGVNLSISRTTFSDKVRNWNFYGAGVFLRQYLPLGKSFYAFAEEGAGANFAKYKNYSGTNLQSVKSSSGQVYFNPGLAYTLTKRLQLEVALPQLASISYTHYKMTDEISPLQNTTSDSFGLSTGLSQNVLGYLSFGMKWII